MGDILEKVLRVREGGAVRRTHTMPWIGHYDVAQHSYNMLVLLDLFNPKLFTPDDALIAKHILYHDIHERHTGDVPNGLRAFPPEVRENFKKAEAVVNKKFGFDVPELSPVGQMWVTALDNLEFYLSCQDQLALGNRNMVPYLCASEEWFATEDVPEEVKEFIKKYRWKRLK